MARYKRFYIPSRGLSRIGGANRVPVTPPGDRTPNPGGRTPRPGTGMSPIGGDGYTPGDRPIGDNSSPDFPDWLAGVGDGLQSITDFLDGPDGSSDISSDGQSISKDFDIQSVIDRIKSSQLYIQAYNLFSSSSDYSLFLQRLEGILDSVNSNYKTWFDELGFSNKYQDSLTEAYNYAIEQIQLLLQEFHQWYNSLPSTQVDQFQQAGINAAITGQGVNGSSLNGQTAQRNFIESTDPLETLNSLSDIALNKIPNVVSTVSSVWKSIQDVRLASGQLDLARRQQDFNESSFLASTRKSLIEQGFSLGDVQWNSLSDFHSWTQRISSDPKLSKMFKDSSVGQLFSDLSYNGIMSVIGSNPETWTEKSFGKTFEEFYNDLGDFQIQTYFDQLAYSAKKAQYDRDYISVRNGKTAGEIQNMEDEMRRFTASFQKTFHENKLSFIRTWTDRIKKSTDPVAKFALTKVLFGDNLVSGLDVGSDGLQAIMDEYKKKGNGKFVSPVGVGTNLGF